MPQTFYQRALSADSDEIIVRAREFLKRNTFAAYCDLVLMPALQLAWVDHNGGAISLDQEAKVRKAVVTVIADLSGERPTFWPWKRRNSVPDEQGSRTSVASAARGAVRSVARSAGCSVGIGHAGHRSGITGR